MRKRPSALRFIINNLGWLVASLALAVLIWYAAVSGQNPVEERRYSERIQITWRLDPGLIVVNTPPQVAQVTIRALQSAWRDIEPENVSIVADLAGKGPDTYTVDLKGELNGIHGGTVVDVQPQRITVELARKQEKRVNVQVRILQDPPIGYEASTTPEQTTALISGPEAAVQRVQAAQAAIGLSNQRSPLTVSVPLLPVDSDNKVVPNVSVVPSSMIIAIQVQLRPDGAELAVDPRFSGDLPTGYFRSNYSWEPRRMVVRGDRTAIEQMNGVIPTEPINLSGRTQTFTQTVKLSLPTGVILPDPTDIVITVEIQPVPDSREFANIPVQVQGLDPADYMITIKPDKVSVIVTGPKVVVDALTDKDISVFAPLTGLTPGKHTVTLQASVARAEITRDDVTVPNNQAEVEIIARNPTQTPTPGPTRTVTPTPTVSVTPGGP